MLFTPLTFWGQEFSFSMYFEDAAGNRDTLVLGYDPTAKNDINLQFGEENILYEPYTKDLDVRTGSFFIGYSWPDSFLTKKHFMPKVCNTKLGPFAGNIYVYCKHFPLRVSWDPVFDDDCNRYSFIADWGPDSWFDCMVNGDQGPFFMKDSASVTFSYLNRTVQYGNVNLNMLYYSIWYSPDLGTRKIAPEKPLIYPNPAKDILYVQTGVGEFESAQIRDLTGRIVLTSSHNPVQISTLRKGAYLLEVKIKGSPDSFVQKFYK